MKLMAAACIISSLTSSGFLAYTLTILSWLQAGSKWLTRSSVIANFSWHPKSCCDNSST
jgi:hypothetical protein